MLLKYCNIHMNRKFTPVAVRINWFFLQVNHIKKLTFGINNKAILGLHAWAVSIYHQIQDNHIKILFIRRWKSDTQIMWNVFFLFLLWAIV